MQGSFIPIVLIIAVLTIYIVWKLMSPAKKKKPEQRRFSIRKHRSKEPDDDDL
jgi:hypothetical protein